MRFQGVGVHSGAGALCVVTPGMAGIRFRRDDGPFVAADWRNVRATRLATVLAPAANAAAATGVGHGIWTVEHLMAALAALGIADADIAVDGPEVPILDGSAVGFFDPLEAASEAAAPRAPLLVTRPVSVHRGDAFAALLPADRPRFDVAIDFPDAIIGVQRLALALTSEAFACEIAPARTFGRLKDVRRYRRMGFARGASLDNAIAVDGARVANPGGLRFADEFVRHKLLDAVGDLALAGGPIAGLYRSHKAGHRLNVELLRAAMQTGALRRPD